MRLAFVASHPDRRLKESQQELLFLAEMRARGVEVRLFRLEASAPPQQLELLDGQVPATVLPSDDASQPRRQRTSQALVAAVRDFRPQLLLFKGLGHAAHRAVADALHPCPIVLMADGYTRDPLLPRAALVLTEYPAQQQQAFAMHHARGRTLLMPRYFDATLATPPDPRPEARYAIVNVAHFHDARKNQTALFGLGQRHRICLVGGGAQLEARQAEAPPLVHFAGQRSADRVYGLLHQAKVMVHPSLQDGLPRAIVEGMACGLPVVAYAEIHPGIRHGETGLVVTPETLEAEVETLLADPARLQAMGEAARQDALAHHGPAALQRAARQFLTMLGQLGLD
ncbi:glycosyltransferase [Falsiroseomonas tokyonensis]|uniref:Glycosyltransferase n=1 Tax=Falsiroseomonas tokyonensis TaxID=430521 RepID=A0ABV7BSM3_9PROT|nr:glycosyltransferase [Falsiroseomonas tokyonensis]MBU8537115.1 glycosyltransferase [Falsiroseomonas tokyonensis]